MAFAVRLKAHIKVLVGVADHVEIPVAVVVDQD